MKEVCFICPTYPKRYKLAMNLLESFNKFLSKQADFYFVFSNNYDSELFGDYGFKIVIPQDMIFKDKSSFVIGKKFFAIDLLKSKYRFLITLDDDSIFFQSVDILHICQSFYNDKILLGNVTSDKPRIRAIKDMSLNALRKHQLQPICNPGLYLWFNQLCIYDSYYIDDFFDKIQYYNRRTSFKFEEFDFYMYSFFLILYHGFYVVDMCCQIGGEHSLCEHDFRDEIIILPQIRKKVMLCRSNSVNIFNNPNLTLIIHLDRDVSTTN